MGEEKIIILMIIACLMLSIILIFPKFFKFVGKFILKGSMGFLFIYMINGFLVEEASKVGINLITGVTCGFLGIPGVILLYSVQNLI